ncbi:Hypothetical protein SCLAV_p0213 (plasmid) [Streptomyces clavuligerus]|uniref:Uncharacterized protein n=1 Tax=Streptomyces clavuligerus TaxID=1901 RepID=D5SIG1_STRCL|nr:Hypothetical protein SCLAV_p0213 [Streptomyces clavuligerus]
MSVWTFVLSARARAGRSSGSRSVTMSEPPTADGGVRIVRTGLSPRPSSATTARHSSTSNSTDLIPSRPSARRPCRTRSSRPPEQHSPPAGTRLPDPPSSKTPWPRSARGPVGPGDRTRRCRGRPGTRPRLRPPRRPRPSGRPLRNHHKPCPRRHPRRPPRRHPHPDTAPLDQQRTQPTPSHPEPGQVAFQTPEGDQTPHNNHTARYR